MKKRFQVPETYYAYIYAYPNGDVFYVGKGSGTRLFAHEEEAKKGCEWHKCVIIRSIWQSGEPVQKRVVFETFDESEALEHERSLIAQYRGPKLTNVLLNPEGERREPSPRSPSPNINRFINMECAARILNCTVEQLIAFISNKEICKSVEVLFMKQRYTYRDGTHHQSVILMTLWQDFDVSSYRLSEIKKHVGIRANDIEHIRNLMDDENHASRQEVSC